MRSNRLKTLLNIGFLAYIFGSTCAQENRAEIIIDLENQPPGEHLTEFHGLQNLVSTRIEIKNINSAVSFFLIQVHSFVENVTLSYQYHLDTNSYTTGTDVGLVWNAELAQTFGSRNVAEFYLLRNSITFDSVNVLITISTYSRNDPVPGGCNLSFETEVAPYQKINETDDIITVFSQPPSLLGEVCNNTAIVTQMYYLYLPEQSKDINQYFAGIQKMISPEDIVRYGTKVPVGLTVNRFKQMYGNYAGTGRVFAIISTYQGRSSAYVPAVSYGCNAAAWDIDCSGPVGLHWRVATALLFLCGLFLCLAGHRFFTIGLVIVAYTFAVIFMLMVIGIHTDSKDLFALIMGLVFAASWLYLWRKFGLPVVAVQLAFLLSGLLITSTLFYSQFGDIYIFSDDLTFWTCFATVLFITQLPLLCLKVLHYILTLSLLGSYAFIVAMNYYFGGNLPYILINTYRRITVTNFGSAVISPPYQAFDICQTVLWVVIFSIGVYVQRKHSLGKPPFPPHRAATPAFQANENSPLLLPDAPPAYSDITFR